MEDHAHRVLELVRAQPPRRGAPTAATRRHRHRHATVTPTTSLVQAKTRALVAAYGIRHTALLTKKAQDDSGSDERDPTSLTEERRRELLEARRRTYRNHFSGLHATHSASGRPKLDTLIEAAMEAKHGSGPHAVVAIGAAVLTSANRIYSSARLGSAQDLKVDVCAERAALLKVLESVAQRRTGEIVEAVVICSDQRGFLPVPCGSCREFLADFGDFPIFLLNAENDSREMRSTELFPLSRHSTLATASAHAGAEIQQLQREDSSPVKSSNNRPLDVRDWSCEHVCQWLEEVVELPQYLTIFSDKRVDGATLWHLCDSDLQLLLGIVHPLHRRRVLLHLDRIKDRELLDHGIDFGQLQDYMAVLDQDRLEVVAQLKETFDRLDINRDGLLDFTELKNALQYLGVDASSAQAAQQLLVTVGSGSSAVTFPTFVRTFSRIAQLPAGETRDADMESVPTVDIVSLRQTFDKADANKSGSIDETELVCLLRSLGRDNCELRAREWFQAVDEDGNCRLSFAEFFLRYTQLTNLDLTKVRIAFDATGDGQKRPQKALEETLCNLFPHVPPSDIRAWCSQRPWEEKLNEGVDDRNRMKPILLSYSEFALACVLYGNALRLRVAQLRAMQNTLHNDGLCHRSRIVELQQSGHVRLCKQGGVKADEEKFASLRMARQAAVKDNTKIPRREDESKEQGEPEDDDDQVAVVYRQFVHRQKSSRNSELAHRHRHEDSKQHSSDVDEGEDAACINADEAAQALIELGIPCSRDQILRYLDREGFGLRREITEIVFRRIFKRLKILQEIPRAIGMKEAVKMQTELWDAMGQTKQLCQVGLGDKRASRTKGRNLQDRNEFLRSKRSRRQGERGFDDEMRGRCRRRKNRRSELDRSRQRSRYSGSRSSSSSSSSGPKRISSRRMSQSRSSRLRSESNSSTASSSERNHPHMAARGGRYFRGFEIGDRVVSRTEGPGTLLRLYRDFFVADVRFDSGKNAKNVDLSRLKRLNERDAHKPGVNYEAKRVALVVGASVCVAHKGTKVATRRGTILRCRTNGSYDVIVNEHGEQELLQGVPFDQVMLARKPVVYTSGARVTIKRKHEYLRGVITMCRTNGTYDVRVRPRGQSTEVLREIVWDLLTPDEDDEDSEREDEEEAKEPDKGDEAWRKHHPRGSRDEEEEAKQAYEDFEPEFEVGDRVEARFNGQSAFYSGRITRVHADNTCDVSYDDGDTETRVCASLIRLLASKVTARTPRGYDDDFESD